MCQLIFAFLGLLLIVFIAQMQPNQAFSNALAVSNQVKELKLKIDIGLIPEELALHFGHHHGVYRLRLGGLGCFTSFFMESPLTTEFYVNVPRAPSPVESMVFEHILGPLPSRITKYDVQKCVGESVSVTIVDVTAQKKEEAELIYIRKGLIARDIVFGANGTASIRIDEPSAFAAFSAAGSGREEKLVLESFVPREKI